MKKLLASLLLSTIGTAAWAGVVYQWETTQNSSTISSAVGYIEISQSAFSSRGASYVAPAHCNRDWTERGCDNGMLSSPILSFYFRVNSSNPTTADVDLNLRQGTGMRYPLEDWFSADFSLHGTFMNLSMFANTGETDMRIQGNTITRFGSDSPYFGYACFSPGCSGAEGRWVKVPEPGTLGLLGIGLFGVLCRRGRKPRSGALSTSR